MKEHKNKNWHNHDGYSRWHPIIQKHQLPIHDNMNAPLEPTKLISKGDILKARDTFKENKELLDLFDGLLMKTDALDILYKLDDLISKLMVLERQENNYPQNSNVLDMEDGKRSPNTVGSP